MEIMSKYKLLEEEARKIQEWHAFFHDEKRVYYILIDSTYKFSENYDTIVEIIKNMMSHYLQEDDLVIIDTYDSDIERILKPTQKSQI